MTPSDRSSRHKIISTVKDPQDGCGKLGGNCAEGVGKGKCWAKRLSRSDLVATTSTSWALMASKLILIRSQKLSNVQIEWRNLCEALGSGMDD